MGNGIRLKPDSLHAHFYCRHIDEEELRELKRDDPDYDGPLGFRFACKTCGYTIAFDLPLAMGDYSEEEMFVWLKLVSGTPGKQSSLLNLRLEI